MYKLREQVAASGRNVILGFPEEPKDAGDSGCGKLKEAGGLEENIAAVGLLDASCGQLDAFVDWAARKPDHRLFSSFTDHLAAQNVYLRTHLKKRDVAYSLMDEQDATGTNVAKSRILFLHTQQLKHGETVGWLKKWLKAVIPL